MKKEMIILAIEKKNFKNRKFIAGFLTMAIIGMLIISGPAQAVILGFEVSKNEVEKGEKINFIVSVKIESEDSSINYLSLELSDVSENNPINIDCRFNPDGEIINGCNGISIEKIKQEKEGHGYGYGYGYGYSYGYGEDINNLVYNITMDTNKFIAGKYKTLLIIHTRDETYEKKGSDITIKTSKISLKSCSIRAKKGISFIENTSFGDNNKLNFFVSNLGARKGQGYIIGQKQRETYSYKFIIGEILENNDNQTILSISGRFRLGLKKEKIEKSLIILNKKSNNVEIIGNNLNIKYMNVNFKDGCK